MSGRTRIALIVDHDRVSHWQAQALLEIADEVDVLVLNCTNTRLKRKPFRHFLYYLLNIVALRSPQTRSVALPERLNIVERVNFEAESDGAWQRLPEDVLAKIQQWRPVAAIKFGMGLLRIPEQLDCKILSYHHGDPRRFRGRPAGFYELLGGEPVVGQMVQIISNRLDAGEVVAFAETRVQPNSYRRTMADSYRTSPLLIRKALRNCLAGRSLPLDRSGRNYRLPWNGTVLRFASGLLAAKISRLLYGAFVHKAWEVASATFEFATIEQLAGGLRDPRGIEVVPRPSEYRFLADPFPHPDNGVLVEALRSSDGQGEIVHFAQGSARVLCRGTGHFSYPATVNVDGEWFMLPEVAEWTTPMLYRLSGDECALVGSLDVEGSPRLADATLSAGGKHLYLFANDATEGSGILRLWVADSIHARFAEHPESPIRISPVGGRMAGAILDLNGRLYRLGQDCSRAYGRRIVVFEIVTISPSAYEEFPVGELALEELNGPHTFNLRGDTGYFDFYRERFSPFAGVHRLRALRSKRAAIRSAHDRASPATVGRQHAMDGANSTR